jgi:glucan phosphoethanolaminetransferase (alkaline phosphatase superfamily)
MVVVGALYGADQRTACAVTAPHVLQQGALIIWPVRSLIPIPRSLLWLASHRIASHRIASQVAEKLGTNGVMLTHYIVLVIKFSEGFAYVTPPLLLLLLLLLLLPTLLPQPSRSRTRRWPRTTITTSFSSSITITIAITATNHELPTTNHQPPTTNHQPPTTTNLKPSPLGRLQLRPSYSSPSCTLSL